MSDLAMLALLTRRIPPDVGAFLMFFPALTCTIFGLVLVTYAYDECKAFRKTFPFWHPRRWWATNYEASLGRWMLGDAALYWLLTWSLVWEGNRLTVIEVAFCAILFLLAVDVFRHWANAKLTERKNKP